MTSSARPGDLTCPCGFYNIQHSPSSTSVPGQCQQVGTQRGTAHLAESLLFPRHWAPHVLTQVSLTAAYHCL